MSTVPDESVNMRENFFWGDKGLEVLAGTAETLLCLRSEFLAAVLFPRLRCGAFDLTLSSAQELGRFRFTDFFFFLASITLQWFILYEQEMQLFDSSSAR